MCENHWSRKNCGIPTHCSHIRASVHGSALCNIKEQISIDQTNDMGEDLKLICEGSD
jgi:hypothetical protein